MKKTFKGIFILISLTQLVVVLSSYSLIPEATLKKAVFYSHTNDNDKDHDTGIYVTVKTEDGTSTIASIENKDNSGDDGTQYKDGSDHSFDLSVGDAVGMDKNACKNFKVHVWQHTHGNDTWKFTAKVILYFTDGTNITKESNGVTLENDGASTDF